MTELVKIAIRLAGLVLVLIGFSILVISAVALLPLAIGFSMMEVK